MEYDIQEIKNVLFLKNQLASVDVSYLVDVYKDYESYLAFLDTVVVMSDIDSAFLLFSDKFVDKIHRVMQIHRFDKALDKDIYNNINEIITWLNSLQAKEDYVKSIHKLNYLLFQEDIRKVGFYDEDYFVQALANDALVMEALENNHMELIEDDVLFLASVNYLRYMIPDFFEDEEILERTVKKIDDISREKGFSKRKLRKYSSITKNNLFNKQKEEY